MTELTRRHHIQCGSSSPSGHLSYLRPMMWILSWSMVKMVVLRPVDQAFIDVVLQSPLHLSRTLRRHRSFAVFANSRYQAGSLSSATRLIVSRRRSWSVTRISRSFDTPSVSLKRLWTDEAQELKPNSVAFLYFRQHRLLPITFHSSVNHPSERGCRRRACASSSTSCSVR
jgi:hypothetical protein